MRMLGLYPKQIITKILCYSLLLAIVSFFLYVVAISNITFFTPYLQKYDAEITTRLSVFFAHKVKVGEVSFAKHKLQPVLLLRDLDVFNANSDKPLLHVNELSVQINVWRSLLAKRIVEEGVTINGTVLSMQTGGKSSLSINGMDLGGIQQGADGVSVPANGGIKIRMVNVTVVAAQWFAKPLIIDELHGKVSWRRSAQEMSIAIKNFVLQSQSLRAHGDVALTKILSDKLLPYVDTRIYFSCTQLEELQNFYPSKIMKVGLLHWLNAAFSAGYIDGEFDLHGNLSHFPFDDNNGVFKVNIDLHALDFFYHQYWPKIRQLNGRLLFHGNSMEVIADSAIISGAPLRNVHASISNLYLPRLIVVGQVNTTASLAQNFLATSPLSSSFGRYNNYVKLEGPVIIEISMEIPLTEFANASANESQVHGKINFLNDTLGLSSAPTGFPMDSSGGVSGDNSGMVSSQREASCGDVKSCNSKANSNTKSSKLLEILWHNIVGTINFNNTTIWADNLKATLFDKPLTMHIKTADDVIDGGSSRVVRLVFDHSVSIAMVKQYLKWPIFNFLQGNIDYRAVLRLPQRQSENITLGITSNLQNVSIAYPPLLTKALGVSHDFNMRIVFPNDEMWAANIFMCYKDEFSSALGFVKKQSHLEFVAGELHFGKHAVTKILTDNGLVVSGRIRQLNWSDWQSYLSPGKNKNKRGDKKFELELAGWVKFIKKIDLVIDELNIFGNAFSDLHLLVVPQEDGWAVNLDNKLISGVLSVPYDWSDGVLVAGLSKLYLANSKIFKNSNFNPGDFPKMQIMINDLRYAGKMLGKLELKTEPITNGLSVVRLLISAANFTLEGTGKWIKIKQVMHSFLQGKCFSKNVGSALKQLHFSESLVGASGQLDFALEWDGPYYKLDMSSLIGNAKINMQKGRIINLSANAEAEMGIGRLISILGLQTLPRRLTLDFSDLVKDGFSFDTLQGSFEFDKGNASFSDMLLQGPSAQVEVQGKIGFATKDYDMKLTVIPHLTSSLPVIATVAGGPLVGAATWVADKLIGGHIMRVMGYVYSVTGPWSNPNIQKI